MVHGQPPPRQRNIPTHQVDKTPEIISIDPDVNPAYVSRTRIYSFTLDERGQPIEIGSGRFAKAYLGVERWIESKTSYSRNVCIKILQKGVGAEAQLRFQLEKEILERVQGHSNIIELLASGEGDNTLFIPPELQDRVENDYMVLDLLDLSLEERLKGSRASRRRDDLLALDPQERLFRVLDYTVPVAIAVEYAHLKCDTCHRDIKPANILLKMPDPELRGSSLEVKLADFNVGKAASPDEERSMTRFQTVPGTLFFQSPEQETNTFELLVNVTAGSAEVEFFEDFYIDICENDTFQLFNRPESYQIAGADRGRKKLVLTTPYAERSEQNVRAKVIKAVGRPADIYSLGAVLYYLVSGAYANPKTLYDAFHKFIEYEAREENNTIADYIDHEYQMIDNIRAPKSDQVGDLPPEHRFFSYKHYLDGNGELIDKEVMLVIARSMIRNKPDSYCQAWDLSTRGITDMVEDLLCFYSIYGVNPSTRFYRGAEHRRAGSHPLRRAWDRLRDKLARNKTRRPRRPRRPTRGDPTPSEPHAPD
jgi:serine/threonine protein kinase